MNITNILIDLLPKEEEKINNPVWHIHTGNPPFSNMIINFSMLLNLVSASGSEDEKTLWTFIKRYKPNIVASEHPDLERAVKYAINYYQDFVKPNKKFRNATIIEKDALIDLYHRLEILRAIVKLKKFKLYYFLLERIINLIT